MASYNRIVLVGNLTRDPQLSYTANNVAVCKFGIATNHRWRDREGNQRDETCFVDCTLFGKGGEVFNQYMAKGRPVLIEGRLTFDQWTSPEGEKKSKHQVFVENFTFLGSRADGAQQGGGAPQGGGERTNAAPVSARNEPEYDYAEPPPKDNIPF